MTDRELLELTAKAAGIKGWWLAEFKTFQVNTAPLRNFVAWNPLTDDGDALRLAVKLRFDVMCHEIGVHVDNDISYSSEISHNDPYAATRRAIVRAAAAIGKEQP